MKAGTNHLVQRIAEQDAISETRYRLPNASSMPALFSSFSRRVREAGYGTVFYSWRLGGRHPLQLLASPEDPIPGSARRGEQILEGNFIHSGVTVAFDQGFWGKVAQHASTHAYAHSFDWLRDLAASSDRASARAEAEYRTKEWLRFGETWRRAIWAPEILSRRLLCWCLYAPLILSSTDLVYRSQLLNSMARQARHLCRTASDIPLGLASVTGAATLFITGHLLPGGQAWAQRGERLLRQGLADFIKPDGSPVSRQLQDALEILRLLDLIKQAADQTRNPTPPFIQSAVDRLVPFIKALMHDRRSFCRFGPMDQSYARHGAQLLVRAQDSGSPLEKMPYGGYERLGQGQSILIIDAAPPAPISWSHQGHASTGAMEFSSGGEVIFTAIGHIHTDSDPMGLEDFARTSAAHSVLVLDDRNSSEILAKSVGRGVTEVKLVRSEGHEGHLLSLRHDGYQKRLKSICHRSLLLSEDGNKLEGVDQITSTGRQAYRGQAIIRFHLHPQIQAYQEDESIQLTTKSGNRWSFTCHTSHMDLDESLYVDPYGSVLATKQITLPLDDQQQVQWTLALETNP